ncbi:MAG: M23 family metallopeptidase [Bdellovibrionales bacterium]|nr:M23 family metallopeptidase [Bdellovibrionales bacterium]
MNKKTFTILISSNRKGHTRSLTISSGWLKASLVLGVFVSILFAAGVVDYVGLLLQAGENKRLKAESTYLKQEFKKVEGKLVALEKSLEQVSIFTKKLKMITNIDDSDRSIKASLGPMPKLGQNVSDSYGMEDGMLPESESPGFFDPSRQMASVGATSSASSKAGMFSERAILDVENGELSATAGRNYEKLSIRIDRAVRASELQEQGVIALLGTLSERQFLLDATPSIRPARGWLTSRFGYRLDPFTGKTTMHNGIDFAAPPGTPVYAPADGIISYVGYEHGYGKLVSIDHGYGVVTRYGHNSQIYVELGQKITRRDIISAIGSTGRSSGPHVHYEVRVNGIPVDPMNYILEE